jgi:hypothetical protein
MKRFRRLLGSLLVALSVLAVVQTAREILLWKRGFSAYLEESPLERTIRFGGHTFTVVDDQPSDVAHSETAFEGTVQLLMDGRPLHSPARALVRRGRADLGRYHMWLDAWVFRDRATSEQTLWFAQRRESAATLGPRFEVTEVSADGAIRTRQLRGWQLGSDYRLFRATQFVRRGEWSVFPLAVGDVAGLFPLLLLVLPLGTFLVGILLMRQGRGAGTPVAAV